jgi:hypothetical protein
VPAVVPHVRMVLSEKLMLTVVAELDCNVTVPLVTVYELAVGRTAHTGLGRTAKGPTASIAVNNLRSDSRVLDAIFIWLDKQFVTRLRLTAVKRAFGKRPLQEIFGGTSGEPSPRAGRNGRPDNRNRPSGLPGGAGSPSRPPTNSEDVPIKAGPECQPHPHRVFTKSSSDPIRMGEQVYRWSNVKLSCREEAQESEGECSSSGAYRRPGDSRQPDRRFLCFFAAILPGLDRFRECAVAPPGSRLTRFRFRGFRVFRGLSPSLSLSASSPLFVLFGAPKLGRLRRESAKSGVRGVVSAVGPARSNGVSRQARIGGRGVVGSRIEWLHEDFSNPVAEK